MSAIQLPTDPPSRNREYLTSQQWLSVFDRLPEQRPGLAAAEVRLDFSNVQWVGHLPLLALSLVAQTIEARHGQGATALMPEVESVRAFLDRWGFYDLLRNKGIKPIREAEAVLARSFTNSCVLPIHPFSSSAEALALARQMKQSGGTIYNLLKTAAFLDDAGIRGFADLIVKELCNNVPEHSAADGQAFILGRVSKQDDKVRGVYEGHAAEWETDFFRAIHAEGMTELVLGDSGVGIVQSLAEQAMQHGKTAPKDILAWAFDPFSTSKHESEHTRGLWAVRNKVRDMRGVLYVRTSDGRGGGVSAWWDFLNHPDSEDPKEGTDQCAFPGTQFQILLPHLTEQRPWTFISRDRASAAGTSKDFRPIGFQVPPEPPPDGESLGLVAAISKLGPREVLFIDMSRMNQDAWDRPQVDELGMEIARLLHPALSTAMTSGLATGFRRIWLLNPSADTLNRLASSSWVTDLWHKQGILQPVVGMHPEDPTRPPNVRFVVSDSNGGGTGEEGDTKVAREELCRLIRNAFGSDTVNSSSISTALREEERGWLDVHLAMNASSVTTRVDADASIVPAFDVEALASATVEALLPETLRDRIDLEFKQQNSAPELACYQLPSNQFCENYIDPRILTDLDAPTRNAMEKWIEQRVLESRAGFAISYTNLASFLLTRATRASPGIKCLPPLKHYVEQEYEELEKKIPPGAGVVILVSISGSATTIEKILERLLPRPVTVVCVIDTRSAERRRATPGLAELEATGAFKVLLSKEIRFFDEKPKDRLIAVIDPETLVPVAPVRSLSSIMPDGKFWSIVGKTRGLSIEPITYKGRDFTTLFWMRNIFKSPMEGVNAVDEVLNHMAECFDGKGPDIICVTRDTHDALQGTGATKRTYDRLKTRVISEANADEFRDATAKLEGKNVVIFAAAAYSGGAITSLLEHFETARRIHICVFLTRISEPMITSFTRQPKVTFTAFRRLYSGSSEATMGSSRIIRLQNLADYRPSCISNRLLLFVEEEQEKAKHHAVAQDPDGLDSVATPLLTPARDLFVEGEEYDFKARNGMSSLLKLVRRCSRKDASWLYAVLEEAASRVEISSRTIDNDTTGHLDDVCQLYKNATDRLVKTRILEALLLDRWHGREEITKAGIPSFGFLLLSDLQDGTDEPDFHAACIRALSKIHRTLLIEKLEEIVDVARRHRYTEMTLALELTKILDDDKGSDDLRNGLADLLNKRARSRGDREEDTATDVAIQCLLTDVGLHRTEEGLVEFLPWEEMFAILRSEPPDAGRTIRSLIRSIRGMLGPRARIIYLRSEPSSDRFVYLDAWPRKEATAPRPVRERSIIAARLLSGNQIDEFIPNISAPGALDKYFDKLSPVDQKELRDNALFVHRVGKNGVLRIFYEVGGGHGMPGGSVPALQKAIGGVTGSVKALMQRPDSPLTAFGNYQYRQTVENFQSHTGGADPLIEFAEHVHSLLGADSGSVVVLDELTEEWSREHVTGTWSPQKPAIRFSANDDTRLTVEVARIGLPRKFGNIEDRMKAGFIHEGIVSWAPAWLAMPLRQQDGYRVVLHFWHHIERWFDAHPDDLIKSLCSLGGGIVQIKADYERARHAQQQEFDRTKIDHLAARLRDLILVAEDRAVISRDEKSTDHLDDLADDVAAIHEHVEALLGIVHQDGLAPMPSDLWHVVENSVVDACERYGADRFEPLATDGERVAVRIGDPRMLSRAFQELLKNANAHLKPESRVGVRVHYKPSSAAVCIEVRNPGYGVEDGRKSKIFDSSGTGLKLARLAARRHGGQIVEVGTFGRDAVFRMTLPIAEGRA